MLKYEEFCQIRDHLGRQHLSMAQTARALGMDIRTITKWADVEQFRPRSAGVQRVGKLDAYKGQIVRWLDTHPYSAQQIYQRLCETGFDGGRTIVKDLCNTASDHTRQRRSSNLTSAPARPPKSIGVNTAALPWVPRAGV